MVFEKKRILLFAAGVLLVGCGVGMITKAGLGTSAITSLAYVFSMIFPPTLGIFAFLFNVCMVIIEALLLFLNHRIKGKGDWIRIALQIPAAILFASSIDGLTWLLRPVVFSAYWQQILMLLAGVVVFSLGAAMEVTADIIVLPAEAMIKAVSEVAEKNFGTVKTIVDCSVCAAAIICSLAAFGEIRGVREGTVVTALAAGSITRFFLSRLRNAL
ncbi:MAG: hypothetical protein IJ860_00360 [Eubacterium sp.]|nr:hypothetical protein [Eubacterium sp.]